MRLFLTILFFSMSMRASAYQAAITQPIPLNDIDGYKNYPSTVQKLLKKALVLSQEKLTYQYGSADPKNGGMDCSGTIYYLLSSMLKNVPRDSEQLFNWVKQKGQFHSVSANDFQSSDFSQLKPGDLLFWSGTYATTHLSGISHVMIYLGETKNHEPLMFGASDGRTYKNKKMWGVSVFDFKLPRPNSRSHFLGYSCIPDLTCNEK